MLADMYVYIHVYVHVDAYALIMYVLQLSTLGTFPFFVENVNALQLSALRLVRAVRAFLCMHVHVHVSFCKVFIGTLSAHVVYNNYSHALS